MHRQMESTSRAALHERARLAKVSDVYEISIEISSEFPSVHISGAKCNKHDAHEDRRRVGSQGKYSIDSN